jgi:hypothetical protein
MAGQLDKPTQTPTATPTATGTATPAATAMATTDCIGQRHVDTDDYANTSIHADRNSVDASHRSTDLSESDAC